MATPAPAPQDQDPFADRRASPRVAVALPGFLQASGARHFVHILDVSAGGAKVKCPANLECGAAATLDCGALCREAVVRWQNGELIGLSFDRELDAREVAALTERSAALEARMKAHG